jgi:predicted nucleotidyltransferase component of viral defense system
MDVPLKNLLKKRSQQELASLQDEVVDLLYSVDSTAIFHGGTSIWRCYGGRRFSEDLDFYLIPKNNFKEKLVKEANKRGLEITKFRQTDNSIFSKVSSGRIECSLELALREKKGVFGFYTKVDGSTINIFVLTKEQLILEKARAFVNRKLIRDIYDVFFLIDKVNLIEIKDELLKIINLFEEPLDEKNLKALIYSGISPTYSGLKQHILSVLK